jgi:hypothetical protein
MNFKRLSLLFFIVVISLPMSSCFKHRRQIRVKNFYAFALNVKVGPADFGSVPSMKTSEYKDIPKGTLEVTGDIGGHITVPGGKHIYTLYINTGGAASLIEDKK